MVHLGLPLSEILADQSVSPSCEFSADSVGDCGDSCGHRWDTDSVPRDTVPGHNGSTFEEEDIPRGHWSLIVICNFGELVKNEVGDVNRPPCVLHLDSLRNKHAGLKEFIHSYLREEWKSRASEDISKRFDNLKLLYLKQLPQQENGNDCGLFLLHYTQLFLEEFLDCSKVLRGSKFLKADWFTPSEASDKRMVIKKLIYDLKEKQKSPLSTSKKPDEPKSEEAVEWMRREFPGSKHKALETSKQMLPDCEDKNESLLKQVETWSVELYLEKIKNLSDANALLRSELVDINEQALIQEEKEKAYDLFDKRIHARLMASKSKFNMLKLGNKSLKCAELEERLVQIEAGAVNE
ncbi:ulp1 protease family, C-terminal catalytic domain-containing protein [Artemisia annua]|uniref:Ulp1 protease family, C-terminal catalytic domain-containing protein n=1 Tax=Artemisia annua TaxID=35608 RepID=A0A2U1NUB4_ARTAN|nr:ulp1 protease family, C-terminal catalytic domain-containing protein [Artemisia annua]